MFKIGSGRTAWIAVKWKGLAEDGTPVDNEIQCKVNLVERDALQAQLHLENESEHAAEHSLAFIKENTLDWKGVGDADGRELPFTPENFHSLCQSPGFTLGFGPCYLNAWSGISGIREKNSATSPADGLAAGEANPPKEA